METKLKFISAYNGRADFIVSGGPMNGKQIYFHYLDPEGMRLQWNPKIWRMDRNQFEREVIGACYVVHHHNKPVTDDVLEAVKNMAIVNADKAQHGMLDKETGKWKIFDCFMDT